MVSPRTAGSSLKRLAHKLVGKGAVECIAQLSWHHCLTSTPTGPLVETKANEFQGKHHCAVALGGHEPDLSLCTAI